MRARAGCTSGGTCARRGGSGSGRTVRHQGAISYKRSCGKRRRGAAPPNCWLQWPGRAVCDTHAHNAPLRAQISGQVVAHSHQRALPLLRGLQAAEVVDEVAAALGGAAGRSPQRDAVDVAWAAGGLDHEDAGRLEGAAAEAEVFGFNTIIVAAFPDLLCWAGVPGVCSRASCEGASKVDYRSHVFERMKCRSPIDTLGVFVFDGRGTPLFEAAAGSWLRRPQWDTGGAAAEERPHAQRAAQRAVRRGGTGAAAGRFSSQRGGFCKSAGPRRGGPRRGADARADARAPRPSAPAEGPMLRLLPLALPALLPAGGAPASEAAPRAAEAGGQGGGGPPRALLRAGAAGGEEVCRSAKCLRAAEYLKGFISKKEEYKGPLRRFLPIHLQPSEEGGAHEERIS
ncbi:unnamed protein product [Prorocentrum cordatum]|uniref:Subtilisin n=1 Tax=Prorocentrum cordatum TaxID=2364126 RepID=A0ABN9WNF7_9DINO|nr:unnamed protein product [Polarella glacialis]